MFNAATQSDLQWLQSGQQVWPLSALVIDVSPNRWCAYVCLVVSCVTVGTDKGYCIYTADPLQKVFDSTGQYGNRAL